MTGGDVGARIRAARVGRDWTQARLGRLVGATGQHVSAVELGQRTASPVMLDWLATAEQQPETPPSG